MTQKLCSTKSLFQEWKGIGGSCEHLTDNLMEGFFEKGSFTGWSLVLCGEEEQEGQ